MIEQSFEATLASIPAVTAFVDAFLEEMDCPMRAQMQIDIAIDEIFSNIARYAYAPGTGSAAVRVEADGNAVTVTFADRGVPYDPLAKEDPDITLSLEERPVGGLGIFMVKKIMDEVRYEYRDGQNIVSITKRI